MSFRVMLGVVSLWLAVGVVGLLRSHDPGQAAYPGSNGVLLFESPQPGE